MRIDSRFDSESWDQPRAKGTADSARLNDSQPEHRDGPAAPAARTTEADFVREVQAGHAFTRASRTAESVADMLAATSDL